jgi:hypothetical protein
MTNSAIEVVYYSNELSSAERSNLHYYFSNYFQSETHWDYCWDYCWVVCIAVLLVVWCRRKL